MLHEVPRLPEAVPKGPSLPHTAPHTPSNRQTGIPLLPPPNFQLISISGDIRSLRSTLAAMPQPPTVTPAGTPSSTDKLPPSLARNPVQADIIEGVSLSYSFGESQLESKLSSTSGKSTAYTLPRYAPRTLRQMYGILSGDPQSRLSWQLNVNKAKGFYTKRDRYKGFYTRWFIDWWLFEIICWILSAVLMAVILAVLAHYNGKPIPHWTLGMTLNAFISVLSGFSRAALLLPVAEALGQLKWIWFTKKPRQMIYFEDLDSASRGPWGSFVLLARSKEM
jgi:hypothetical protein